MINPLARRAMFERFQQRLEPRHTMAQIVRNPGLRRYAFGGEVPTPGGMPTPRPGPMPAYQPPGPALQTSPQPMSRTIPNPRALSNPLMPGPSLSTTSGSPYRPDPLSGWNPFGTTGSPQAGTGTEPGFTWPSMGAARQPYVPGQGGGFGNGRIQTFAHGGEVGDPGSGSWDLAVMEGLNPGGAFHEPVNIPQNPEGGSSTTAYGGDNLNNQIAAEGGDVQGEYGHGFNPNTFFYGITPPQGTPGASQGNTMIPTSFDSQGYPYAVLASGITPGSLAGTNYWDNPSDAAALQNISGGHLNPVNKGGKVPQPQVPLQGYGKDTYPIAIQGGGEAALTPGETIIPRPGDTSNARRKYLLAMAKNEGRKRYQTGGKVGAQLEDPNFDPLAFLQEQDHEDNLTPEDLETRRKVQAMLDERERKSRMNERQ